MRWHLFCDLSSMTSVAWEIGFSLRKKHYINTCSVISAAWPALLGRLTSLWGRKHHINTCSVISAAWPALLGRLTSLWGRKHHVNTCSVISAAWPALLRRLLSLCWRKHLAWLLFGYMKYKTINTNYSCRDFPGTLPSAEPERSAYTGV